MLCTHAIHGVTQACGLRTRVQLCSVCAASACAFNICGAEPTHISAPAASASAGPRTCSCAAGSRTSRPSSAPGRAGCRPAAAAVPGWREGARQGVLIGQEKISVSLIGTPGHSRAGKHMQICRQHGHQVPGPAQRPLCGPNNVQLPVAIHTRQSPGMRPRYWRDACSSQCRT